jgi:hypothetical protein
LSGAAVAAAVPLVLQSLHFAFSGAFVGGQAEATPSEGLVLADNAFDLASPHFLHVLFSCQHGLFYWAPLLGVGFLGLIGAARGTGWARLFLATFLCNVYIVGALSGTNWTGGYAFGMRYLVESTPLLAVGLATLMDVRKERAWRIGWVTLLGVCVVWNGLLILAYGMSTISHGDCVTHGEMLSGVVEAIRSLAHGGMSPAS